MAVTAAVKSQSASGSSSSCDFGCFDIFEPVCASNGETFGNACEFNRTRCTSGDDTLTIVSQGPCSSASGSSSGSESFCLQEFACLDVYAPVCGSDGQTYSNECFLRRAQCSNSTLTTLADGECGGDNSTKAGSGEDMNFASSTSDAGICTERICTKQFQPLCGSDGVTYNNECLFQNAKCGNSSLTLAFEGECSSESGSSASMPSMPGPVVGSHASISSDSASSETDAAGISCKRFSLLSVVTVLLAIVTL